MTLDFWRPKRTSKKKIFIWWKRYCRKLSCGMVHLFIALVIIEISFDLYLSIGSDFIETHMYTFVLPTHVIFLALPTGWSIGLKILLTSPGWEVKSIFMPIDHPLDKARKRTWVGNTKVYICVSILSIPMERYKSKDISIITRAINKWITSHGSLRRARFHHFSPLEVLFGLQNSKVTLNHVYHCKLCCALKTF